jgi:two-component system sensor histidine kinase BarA
MRSDSARRVRDRRRWITISVSDTGPGVPPTSRDSIFQEFVRIAHDGVEGLGVGLSISRRLARLLGGEITLQSEVGAGSTFTLWLPLDWDESTGGAEQRSP